MLCAIDTLACAVVNFGEREKNYNKILKYVCELMEFAGIGWLTGLFARLACLSDGYTICMVKLNWIPQGLHHCSHHRTRIQRTLTHIHRERDTEKKCKLVGWVGVLSMLWSIEMYTFSTNFQKISSRRSHSSYSPKLHLWKDTTDSTSLATNPLYRKIWCTRFHSSEMVRCQSIIIRVHREAMYFVYVYGRPLYTNVWYIKCICTHHCTSECLCVCMCIVFNVYLYKRHL